MGHRYAAIAFTEEVKKVQQAQNSRAGYAGMEVGEDFNHLLSEREAQFIQSRDSFYMASVSETNWPYVQHRGGPVGFLQVLDEKTIGFADFSGNRQYISTGNLHTNNRVSLMLMDYPNRTRMKILGRVEVIAESNGETLSKLEVPDYRANVERGFIIHIEAFDWNCPQHITPRYSDDYVEGLLAPLIEENDRLQATISNNNEMFHVQTHSESLGTGPLKLVVTGIRQLTPRVRAFEFRSPDDSSLPTVRAGAHLAIPFKSVNGELDYRNYTICSNPARSDIYEIAVLSEPNGLGGSIAIHKQYQLGLSINCKTPSNHFELHDDDRAAILIAGGIGITPIKAMAQALEKRSIPFRVHYAGRTKKEMAFRDRLEREFGDKISLYSSSENERMNIAEILGNTDRNTPIYVCGPSRLIDSIVAIAKNQHIPLENIRYERFSAPIDEDAKPISVTLKRSNRKVQVNPDQSILEAILEAGISAPHSCKVGACKSCAVKVIEGTPDHRDTALTDGERSAHKLMCPCVSRARSENLILDL